MESGGGFPQSGPPTGPATGDLAGTYPAPTIGAGKVVAASIGAGAVTPSKVAVADSAGLSGLMVVRVAFAAGTPGVARDVVVYAVGAVPFKLRVVDADILVSTAIAASSGTLRDNTGGLGNALLGGAAIGTAGAGKNSPAAGTFTADSLLQTTDGLVLRLSDGGVAGTLRVYVRPE